MRAPSRAEADGVGACTEPPSRPRGNEKKTNPRARTRWAPAARRAAGSRAGRRRRAQVARGRCTRELPRRRTPAVRLRDEAPERAAERDARDAEPREAEVPKPGPLARSETGATRKPTAIGVAGVARAVEMPLASFTRIVRRGRRRRPAGRRPRGRRGGVRGSRRNDRSAKSRAVSAATAESAAPRSSVWPAACSARSSAARPTCCAISICDASEADDHQEEELPERLVGRARCRHRLRAELSDEVEVDELEHAEGPDARQDRRNGEGEERPREAPARVVPVAQAREEGPGIGRHRGSVAAARARFRVPAPAARPGSPAGYRPRKGGRAALGQRRAVAFAASGYRALARPRAGCARRRGALLLAPAATSVRFTLGRRFIRSRPAALERASFASTRTRAARRPRSSSTRGAPRTVSRNATRPSTATSSRARSSRASRSRRSGSSGSGATRRAPRCARFGALTLHARPVRLRSPRASSCAT